MNGRGGGKDLSSGLLTIDLARYLRKFCEDIDIDSGFMKDHLRLDRPRSKRTDPDGLQW